MFTRGDLGAIETSKDLVRSGSDKSQKLGIILKDVDGRYVIFDNSDKHTQEERDEKCVKPLLDVIRSMDTKTFPFPHTIVTINNDKVRKENNGPPVSTK